jgi:hypothetical protein
MNCCLRCMSLELAQNVVCYDTAIRLESGAKRTALARAQNVADDLFEILAGYQRTHV